MAYYIKSAENEFIIRGDEGFSKNKNPKNSLRKIVMLKLNKFPALGIIFSLENFDPDIGIESFSKCFNRIISIDEVYLRKHIGINFLETGTYLRCIPSSETVDELGFNYLGWEELDEFYFDENQSDETTKLVCKEIEKIFFLDESIILNSELGWANFLKELIIIKNFNKSNIKCDIKNLDEYDKKHKNYLSILKKNLENSMKTAIFCLKNEKYDDFDMSPDLGDGSLSASLRHYLDRDERSQVLETTPIEIPVGFMSAHRDALMGRNGHAFLTGGSNNLIEQYDNKDKKNKTAELWNSLLINRNYKVNNLNSKFIQIIIPEKISVYPDLFPFEINTPTNNLSELEKSLKKSNFYISVLDIFSNLDTKSKEIFYKKLDTHLQPAGSYAVFSHIVSIVFNFITEKKTFDREIILKGDLCDRILGHLIYDKFYDTENDAFMSDRVNIETFHASHGKHIGQYSIWNNPSAPIKKKVIAFGNSFFGNCLDQGCIGWWFSNYIEKFHCIWSPNIDFDLIEKEKPDLVICQTVERFMKKVPEY